MNKEDAYKFISPAKGRDCRMCPYYKPYVVYPGTGVISWLEHKCQLFDCDIYGNTCCDECKNFIKEN